MQECITWLALEGASEVSEEESANKRGWLDLRVCNKKNKDWWIVTTYITRPFQQQQKTIERERWLSPEFTIAYLWCNGYSSINTNACEV